MNYPKTTEEVLFAEYDEGWGRPLPVKLFTYADGKQDVHRQTGTNFHEAIARAKALLAERGFQVNEKPSFIGITGAYMTVSPMNLEAPEPAELVAASR